MAEPNGELGLDRVALLARAAAEAPVDAETHAAGRVRLLGTAGRINAASAAVARTATRGRAWGRVAALAALLAAAALVFARYSKAPLSYEVSGNTNSQPSYVSARNDAPADVRFSDGSDVAARPGTRLRIEETTSNGARVLVERGETTASIRHRGRVSWAFVAGPFEVRVTGTKLTIAWDPENERIDVTLHEGSVEIETPIGPSHYAVTAGHAFHASVRDGVVKLTDEQNAEPVATRESAEPAAAKPTDSTAVDSPRPRDPVLREGAPRPRDPAALDVASRQREAPPSDVAPKNVDAPEESWTKRVQRGAFADVVAAARARGVGECLAKCGSSDLRALADAARYTGETELASEALHALRTRWKGSHEAAAATFLLGRTAESTGDLAGADRWYTTYLSESPSGALAADALAGRMLAAERLGALSRARQLARDYANRYPDGAAVRAARRLAGTD